MLFIGAEDDVVPLLDGDVSLEMLKEPALVRSYFRELLEGADDARLAALRRELVSLVDVT